MGLTTCWWFKYTESPEDLLRGLYLLIPGFFILILLTICDENLIKILTV